MKLNDLEAGLFAAALLGAALIALPIDASALGAYRTQLVAAYPNAAALGCTNCHAGSPSLSNVNAFGNAFAANNYVFNAALANLDSDGDGYTNGAELTASPASNPGDAASRPAAAPVNGSCGTANGVAVTVAPTANLCFAGTASAVTGTGPWSWTCVGTNGGTTASCSAPQATGATRLDQAIAFGAAPSVVAGGTGTIFATASSGLQVVLASVTPSVCTIAGTTVAGVAAGICTIAADQAGNASYNPAPRATLTFNVTASGATSPPPAPVGSKISIVEYYHHAFNHYFVTGMAQEIAALDAGAFAGWTRTGQTFGAWSGAVTGTAPVCRFFGGGSSHFYTADAGECALLHGNAYWQLEGVVFYIAVPDTAGRCASGTVPVYRLFNNGGAVAGSGNGGGQGEGDDDTERDDHGHASGTGATSVPGVPNHRYTTSLDVRRNMLAQGWTAEGYGPLGVAMCAPQ